MFKAHKNWLLFFTLIAILGNPANGFADEKSSVNPFNIKEANNDYEISHLKCSDFMNMIKTNNPNTFLVGVWLSGLASGLSGQSMQFTDKNFTGTMALAASLCKKNDDMSLFNAFINFQKELHDKNKK